MYKAIIFDLDGTLLDTLEDLAISANYVIESYGQTPFPIEDYKYLVGEGANNLLKKLLPEFNDEKIKEARSIFEEHYALQYDKNTKMYDGISKMLTFVQKKGYKMTVLSNKPNKFTKKCVYKFLNKWNFEAVYGTRDNIERKPSAAGAIAILNELHVNPDEVLFIGDTKTDMITAKNANITSIGVLWGFRDEEELVEYGANHICKTPSDIIKLIDSLA